MKNNKTFLLKIAAIIFSLGIFLNHTDPEEDLKNIINSYKKPLENWPSPFVDKGIPWQEFEPLEVDSLYYETQEKPEVILGKMLFFDPKLSSSNQISCSNCHDPELGWTDHRTVSIGHDHQQGKRNAPSLYNAAFRDKLFWDGRASSLEEQIAGPLEAHNEMNISKKEVVEKLSKINGYKKLFQDAYGSEKVTYDKIAKAIATFERTIKSQPSRFDKFLKGNYSSLTDKEIFGMHIYRTKARCMNCHYGKYLTDEKFHNIGLTYYKREYEDLGLYDTTKNPLDVGKFKTPSLRDLLLTRPWMHNGLMDDLTGIINIYNITLRINNPSKEQKLKDPLHPVVDTLVVPLSLKINEIDALKSFLEALSGSRYKMSRPDFPKN
ncbi:cytochrome-c peroxidase [Apibacter sp. HY039]|uniref:cytochrome-c peroxidase n=1 Tax=Apibacter sp. HY039 TaxID=2501476 RepID=UPI000FEC1C1F|nr:cytochrome-c peroxidase [Apibacter sp. HY039]